MDATSPSGRPTTPRRQLQLQGPRPPRLSVRPESHAIKKPSGAPPQAQGQGHARREEKQQGQPPREPVIIYDASPKIIHTKPSEFMALVQRLTGPGSGALPSEAQTQDYQMDEAVPGQSFLPPELLLSPIKWRSDVHQDDREENAVWVWEIISLRQSQLDRSTLTPIPLILNPHFCHKIPQTCAPSEPVNDTAMSGQQQGTRAVTVFLS
uniref:Uncharacterized protein n=1 Tax=Aegilops tauschii TaxID=37682 RepID=N1QYZ5_AEGTA